MSGRFLGALRIPDGIVLGVFFFRSWHLGEAPCVLVGTYQCMALAHAAQVSLMLENGDTRDDLALPTGTDDADKLAADLKVDFEEGKEILVTVTKVGDVG